MKYIILACLTLAAGASFASTCEVSCSVSKVDILAQLYRDSSGGAYSDFEAYCASLGGKLKGGPSYSGCDLYCVLSAQATVSLSGYGENEFLARQEARKACMSVRDGYGSGCGFSRSTASVGAFTCY